MAFDLDLNKINVGCAIKRYRYAALKVPANCRGPDVSFERE